VRTSFALAGEKIDFGKKSSVPHGKEEKGLIVPQNRENFQKRGKDC